MVTIVDATRQFTAWWASELAGLLPAAWSTPRRTLPRHVISIEADGGLLLDAKYPGQSATGASAAHRKNPVADIARRLAMSDGNPDTLEVGLRLRHAACFARRLELPVGAARDYPRLLALDLERATPFKPKDVYSAFTVDPVQLKPGVATITQLVVKRAVIDPHIAACAAAGVTVVCVDCWSEAGSRPLAVDFLEHETGRAVAPRAASTTWLKVLGGVAAFQLAFAGYLAIDRHEAALAELQAQTSQLKKRVQIARETNQRTQSVAAEIENFRQLRTANVSRVAAIEELTRLLPDSAWITDLKIEGANVSITGLAKSAVALIPALERSPVFVDAVSAAPLTFDQREDKERFSLRARLRTAGAQTAPKPAEIAR